MQLACDNCRTEFTVEVPPGLEGRSMRFRCASCGHNFNTVIRPDEGAGDVVPGDEEGDETGPGMLLKQDGKVYHVKDASTMQKWIVERRVMREDLVSIGGVRWEPVGSRPELEVFFQVVEQADQAAALANSGGPPVEVDNPPPLSGFGEPGPPAGFAEHPGDDTAATEIIARPPIDPPIDVSQVVDDEAMGVAVGLPEAGIEDNAEEYIREEPSELGAAEEEDVQDPLSVEAHPSGLPEFEMDDSGFFEAAEDPITMATQVVDDPPADVDFGPIEEFEEEPPPSSRVPLVLLAAAALLVLGAFFLFRPQTDPPPIEVVDVTPRVDPEVEPAEPVEDPVEPVEPSEVEPPEVEPSPKPEQAPALSKPVVKAPSKTTVLPTKAWGGTDQAPDPRATTPTKTTPAETIPAGTIPVKPTRTERETAVASAAPTPQPVKAPASKNVGELLGKAWVASDSGDYGLSRKIFAEARTLDPNSAEANYGMGYTTEKLGGERNSAVLFYCRAQKGGGLDRELRREISGRLDALGGACP